MKLAREDSLALLLLLAVLIVNTIGLWPELSISRVDLNDNVYHFTLIERIVQAIDRGENPLDCWSPEWTMGYPVLRIYQPLAHLLVVLVYFALGKTVALMTVFVWVRFLSQALLPLSFFAAARLMGLPRLTAAAAAILAPLVSTNFLYGIEYGSYTWAGSGLFPQAVGSHFLLIALGLAFRAIRRGRQLVLTGAVLGLTFLAHLIYGYMGALSVCLLAAMPDADTPRRVRWGRTMVVGAVALLLSAFQLAPLLLDSETINHSRWESVWKWDSFGAGQVITWLFTGELLDHGRLPVLTVLAFAGAGLWLWSWRQHRPVPAAHAFILLGATFWTLVFFGRDFWGPLLTLMGVSADMQLHRVIGGAQIFLVLLAAIALAAFWHGLSRRWHFAAAALATAVLLAPMVQERAENLAHNATWGAKNLEAYVAEKAALDATIVTAKARGGRAYSGLAAQWGGKFKIGEVPFYAFFSQANVPAVSFLYHAMALTSDIMVRFNEWNPSHYRLFNIQTVVAPAGSDVGANVTIPPFLTPIGQNGRFRVFSAPVFSPPGGSYFDVVDALATVKTTKNNFYDINNRWLESDWVAKRIHLLLDWHGDAPPWIPRMAPEEALSRMPALPFPGEVKNEQRYGETYRAEVDARRLCYALFKMTWHANWKAYVDGIPVRTVMLSPGFIGVPLTSGHHQIVCHYEPGRWRSGLAIVGFITVILLMVGEWRAFAIEPTLARIPLPRVRREVLIGCGLVLLAAPICIPLFTSSVLWGHDGFVYFPRLMEVDQNLAHGVLIPRWAPDLGRGTGQPLFLFHPPMIYYLGELWHWLGCNFVTAMNLACATVVLASAFSMFLLARLYFGETGGWLGAAAYLYIPYFAVDLYVRSAMEEFAAFPFIALAMYGFGAFAAGPRSPGRSPRARQYWLIGVAAYTGLLLCHFPAALLFTPLLLAFIALTAWLAKRWQVLFQQALGYVLAVGLGAFIWAPALAARQYSMMNKAVEGNGLYSNHFVYLHQLFYSPWGYGLSVAGPDDGMSFALGWSHLLLIVVAGVWIWRRPRLPGRPMFRFFAVAAALLSILMLQEAIWFWEQVPLLQNVQLPWRLLGPVAVCLALLVAQLGKLLEAVPRWRTAGTAAAMALLIVPNLAHLHTRAAVDVDLYYWTPEQLSLRGFETTTMGEVSPKWMVGLPAYMPVAAKVLAGDAEIQSPARAPLFWTSKVAAKVASTVEMTTAWFPGWEARVDGRAVDAGPGVPSGLITFQVPAGEHTVQVSYGRTTPEKVAAGVSIAALILILMLAFGRFPALEPVSAAPRNK
ncbi:MAG TPA: glycosyltransferase family 39 protein [Candidatus Acidoferrales bacterium]|jgi:hypothetical protein|nr:glycosyltransferase family 39 protein [Candidatus Acidoferrales bacterium]